MIESHTDFDFDALDVQRAAIEGDSVAEQERRDCMRLGFSLALEIITEQPRHTRGQVASVLAHITGLSGFKTQTDLARDMGLTQGRVSQLINNVRARLVQGGMTVFEPAINKGTQGNEC